MGNLAYSSSNGSYLVLEDGNIMEGCCCDNRCRPLFPKACVTYRLSVDPLGNGVVYARYGSVAPQKHKCHNSYPLNPGKLLDHQGEVSDIEAFADVVTFANLGIGIIDSSYTAEDGTHYSGGSRVCSSACSDCGPGTPCTWSMTNSETCYDISDCDNVVEGGMLSIDFWYGSLAPLNVDDAYIGVRQEYRVTNPEAIPVTNACKGYDPGEPAWDGLLPGGGPWVADPVHHHGATLSVKLLYIKPYMCAPGEEKGRDIFQPKAGWVLQIDCVSAADSSWRSIVDTNKNGFCGAPDGGYGDLNIEG